jgi:hypothetical protein
MQYTAPKLRTVLFSRSGGDFPSVAALARRRPVTPGSPAFGVERMWRPFRQGHIPAPQHGL